MSRIVTSAVTRAKTRAVTRALKRAVTHAVTRAVTRAVTDNVTSAVTHRVRRWSKGENVLSHSEAIAVSLSNSGLFDNRKGQSYLVHFAKPFQMTL